MLFFLRFPDLAGPKGIGMIENSSAKERYGVCFTSIVKCDSARKRASLAR